MNFPTLLGVFNYGLILIFGLFLSTLIAGGCNNTREKKIIVLICPLFLLIQSLFLLICGVDIAKQVYPLIVHLPLVFILIFALKKPIGVSFVSVFTTYL